MADRRKRNNSSTTTESPASAETTPESQENTVTATETRPEAEPTEAAAEGTPEEKPAEPDLSAFEAVVATAAEAADDTTGEVPEANLAEVTAEYRKLDGLKAKNRAKAFANEKMKERMAADDLGGARAYLMISDKALVAAPSGAREKAPADPTEAFIQRTVTLRLANELLTTPEGLSEDWADRANKLHDDSLESARAYHEWVTGDEESRGEEPEVSTVVKNAVKLSVGKSAKAGATRSATAYTGERRDIAAHIRSAFASKEVGTFLTIAEIRNTPSEEYGDNPPSAGAVAARLTPKPGKPSSMEKFGIKPDTQNGKKGAVKFEEVSES